MKKLIIISTFLLLAGCDNAREEIETVRLGKASSAFDKFSLGIKGSNQDSTKSFNYVDIDANAGSATFKKIAESDFDTADVATPICQSQVNLSHAQLNEVRQRFESLEFCRDIHHGNVACPLLGSFIPTVSIVGYSPDSLFVFSDNDCARSQEPYVCHDSVPSFESLRLNVKSWLSESDFANCPNSI